MFRRISLVCSTLGLFLTVSTASAAELTGVVNNLPPTLTPITDTTVTVNVFAANIVGGALQFDALGRLTHGPTPLAFADSNRADGSYTVRGLPAGPLVVVLEYNRTGKGVTRRIDHLVVAGTVASRLDVTVPEEEQLYECSPWVVTCSPTCCDGHFSTIRRRLGFRR